MNNEYEKCIRCGSLNVISGDVQSTGKIYFRPKNTKFFTFNTGNISVNAEMCSDCGYISLCTTELGKAKKIVVDDSLFKENN